MPRKSKQHPANKYNLEHANSIRKHSTEYHSDIISRRQSLPPVKRTKSTNSGYSRNRSNILILVLKDLYLHYHRVFSISNTIRSYEHCF